MFVPSEIIRVMIFASIGLFNAVLDVIIWQFLVKLFSSNLEIQKLLKKIKFNVYSLAHTCSFVLTVISSYFLNKSFTFNDSRSSNNPTQSLRFFCVAIFSWIITTTLLNYLTSSLVISKFIDRLSVLEQSYTRKNPLIKKYYPTLAKILTIGVSMITNYTGYRFLVF